MPELNYLALAKTYFQNAQNAHANGNQTDMDRWATLARLAIGIEQADALHDLARTLWADARHRGAFEALKTVRPHMGVEDEPDA